MGGSHISAGVTARRAWLGGAALAAAAALAALAGCGTVVAGKGASGTPGGGTSGSGLPAHGPLQGSVPVGAGPALCTGIAQLRTLAVIRVVTLPSHLHFTFPPRVDVTAPARVAAAASAACRLPEMPRGVMSCPIDFGVSYRLVFTGGSRTYPAVTAHPAGCGQVTGLDFTRRATPAFWVTLGTAMDLAHPGNAAFRGTQR